MGLVWYAVTSKTAAERQHKLIEVDFYSGEWWEFSSTLTHVIIVLHVLVVVDM